MNMQFRVNCLFFQLSPRLVDFVAATLCLTRFVQPQSNLKIDVIMQLFPPYFFFFSLSHKSECTRFIRTSWHNGTLKSNHQLWFIQCSFLSTVQSLLSRPVRVRLGYLKAGMMKSKCPPRPIVWINVPWSMKQRPECLNVAEVDTWTHVLILGSHFDRLPNDLAFRH